MNLPRVELTAGMHRLDVQVAQTSMEHQVGLMKNTLLPLTAAFVADDGTIVNLADMKPLSEESHCSTKPVRYVLEMNQGWFAKKGIKAGSKLGGTPFTGPK